MNANPSHWSTSPGITRGKLAVSRWLETSFELGIFPVSAERPVASGKCGRAPRSPRPLPGRFEVRDPVLFSDGILLTDIQGANIHAGRALLSIPTHFFAGQEPCGQVSSVSFPFGFDEPARRRNPLWLS